MEEVAALREDFETFLGCRWQPFWPFNQLRGLSTTPVIGPNQNNAQAHVPSSFCSGGGRRRAYFSVGSRRRGFSAQQMDEGVSKWLKAAANLGRISTAWFYWNPYRPSTLTAARVGKLSASYEELPYSYLCPVDFRATPPKLVQIHQCLLVRCRMLT